MFLFFIHVWSFLTSFSVAQWDQYDTFIYPKERVLKMTSAVAIHYPLSDPHKCNLDLINESSLLSHLLRHRNDIQALEVTDLFATVSVVKEIYRQLSNQIYCSLTPRRYCVHNPIKTPHLREVMMTV